MYLRKEIYAYMHSVSFKKKSKAVSEETKNVVLVSLLLMLILPLYFL